MDAPRATAPSPSVTRPRRSATWIELPTIGAGTGLIATLVVAASLLAGWSVIYTTPWGTGTGWDQAMYIGAARNLLAGKGLTIAWGLDQGKPLTHFPPLFPSVLALLGLGGLDPWDAARYLNAALRGIDLLLVALLAIVGQRFALGGSNRRVRDADVGPHGIRARLRLVGSAVPGTGTGRAGVWGASYVDRRTTGTDWRRGDWWRALA